MAAPFFIPSPGRDQLRGGGISSGAVSPDVLPTGGYIKTRTQCAYNAPMCWGYSYSTPRPKIAYRAIFRGSPLMLRFKNFFRRKARPPRV